MIPFNVPPYIGKEDKYIKQAIDSRKICGDGQFTKKCNVKFEEMTGAKKVLMTTSGTSALEMAALLTDIKPGWYHIKRRFVENEVGQRFYFDFYGAKWLAFANGPGNI